VWNKAVALNKKAQPLLVRLFDVISLLLEMIVRVFHSTDTAFDVNRNGFQNAPITTHFLSADILLIRSSSLRASLLVISELVPKISTGMRDLVYLAPFPRLWASSRFSRLLVIPQYKD
jgi:hypothetical protein